MRAERRADVVRMLLDAGAHARPDDLPLLVREVGELLGATEAVVYVVDYQQLVLTPMLHKVSDLARDPLPVEGTLAGRAYAGMHTLQAGRPGAVTVWLPLTDGAQRLGVIELVFGRRRELSDGLIRECEHVATLLGALAATRATFGDALEASRRQLPMSTATELQRTLLPPLSFAIPELVIAGALEPSYTVAGDCYDYAVNGEVAHVAILDAIGHAMEATVLAAVAISAYRNARRTGLDLLDTARSMDRWITNQFDAEKFLTGIIAELHIDSGLWRWVTCGHPPALLLRERHVVKKLEQPINLPFGLLDNTEVTVGEERLEPGDHLILHSDGVVEARDADGQFFGPARLADFVSREAFAGLPGPETLRRLMHAILTHQDGHLEDDATVVMLEWRGHQPPGSPRTGLS